MGGQSRGIVYGRVVSGDGGVNAPWSWHLDPNSIMFPGVTSEVTDACPSYVEANLSNWLGGYFGPWSSEIIAEKK